MHECYLSRKFPVNNNSVDWSCQKGSGRDDDATEGLWTAVCDASTIRFKPELEDSDAVARRAGW